MLNRCSVILRLGTVAAAVLLTCLPSLVYAAENGKVVEFTVANLDDSSISNKFRVQLYPEWAPIGVGRFEELTNANFWDDTRIFRIATNFVSQFGINSNPDVQKEWRDKLPIDDDPPVASNERGTLTFASSGVNSRTTQLFINTKDNIFLDAQGFAPVGKILPAGNGYGGMEVVDSFYSAYGERPNQAMIRSEGGSYLQENFPNLSYFEKAEFVNQEEEVPASNTAPTTMEGDDVKEVDSTTTDLDMGGPGSSDSSSSFMASFHACTAVLVAIFSVSFGI